MLNWLRRLLGPVERDDDLVAHIPQIEIDSQVGVRLRATVIDARVVYEVLGGGGELDNAQNGPLFQTNDVDVAVRFFLGTARESVSILDEGGLSFSVAISIAGSNFVGLGDGGECARSRDLSLAALDEHPGSVIVSVRTLLEQHVESSSRVVCTRKTFRREEGSDPQPARKRARQEEEANENGTGESAATT
jgi:hypothetical protein